MGFLTPALLAGAALIAVPVILHLVMRRQPRQLEFPALQFVRQRVTVDKRSETNTLNNTAEDDFPGWLSFFRFS